MKKNLKKVLFTIDWISVVLLLIGGINWGLVGLLNYNLVQVIFNSLSRVIYSIVGVFSLYVILRWITRTYMKK